MQFCRRTLCAIVDKPHCIEDVEVGKNSLRTRTTCTVVHANCESAGMIHVCMCVHYIGTCTLHWYMYMYMYVLNIHVFGFNCDVI